MATKINPLSGFPELLPADRVVEREVIASLSRTFELHGFANIETRVVEPLDRLAKGGEIDKEIYVLRRLQAEDGDGDDPGTLGLHFDLTVPFARYVLEHAGHLEFPFRRYQIQPAWRGERPQEGRYRQFTQADIDIVGRDDAALPPRRRGDAGDGGGARRPAAAAAELPVQQPQADPGLLPRPRAARRDRRDPDHRQAGQAARGRRRRAARHRGRRHRRAGASLPGAGHDPDVRRVVRRPGPRARRRGRPARGGPHRARRRRRGLRGRRSPAASPSRPTSASPEASTTTPAPSSRSSWPATSG